MAQRFHVVAVVMASAAAVVAARGADRSGAPVTRGEPVIAGERALAARFESEVWPLLGRGSDENSCRGCHIEGNKSGLHFYGDPLASFRMLVAQGYFDSTDPDALLARVSSTRASRRMPPGKRTAWSRRDIETLRAFVEAVEEHRGDADAAGVRADERFPAELTVPFTGVRPEGLDNTFITYRQLRGKIHTIFGDDGDRGGTNLFESNIALLGGADFKTRFNESSRATASFLSALDSIARSVSERAYRRRTGPFEGLGESLADPTSLDSSDAGYRCGITRLFRRILYRDPSAAELRSSFELLRSVFASRDEVLSSPFDLVFELTVSDDSTGLEATKRVTIPVIASELGLTQEYVDESRGERRGAMASRRLHGTFMLHGGDGTQRLVLSNEGTHGNVSFAGVELRPVGDLAASAAAAVTIAADASVVEPRGAWRTNGGGGIMSYEDGDASKGDSAITVALLPPRDGEYSLTLLWRRGPRNARSVLVEVFSHDDDHPAHRPPPALPPPGEARYFVDQSEDTIAFLDLDGSFRFAAADGVELSNRGTGARVTADAVKFTSLGDGNEIVIDNNEADGRKGWKTFSAGMFRAYNRYGPDAYHDDNSRKGELFLRYRPSLRKEAWKESEFYRVSVGYAAKRDHEKRAPYIVRARQSSPIVRVVSPHRARPGSTIEIDASATYTVQGSPLRFEWLQVEGAPVSLERGAGHGNGSVVRLRVPSRDLAETAWAGLARALMSHPDFLFTRPPTLSRVRDEAERRRLQLVKVCQDLLARTPTVAEIAALDGGKPLAAFVDEFLDSNAFRDFYFHRIRLYLESHGTPLQDEPVRLWCYVAFNDRPIQEILTADYTVDTSFRKMARPPEHGRSGILTTAGFIAGKPGLPHFNYAAQVAEKFLGYVFEVPPEIVKQRTGITALETTSPDSVCYSCHKLLTPLAYQRSRWDDSGRYHALDAGGEPVDDSDRGVVPSYPFRGRGMEAFALAAARKERFIRTMINTHFIFYFGREMRHRQDERTLYRELWDRLRAGGFTIRGLLRAIMSSPEYLRGEAR